MADERTVNDVRVYRDSAGFYREYPVEPSSAPGSGAGIAAAVTPITSTYSMDMAVDGLNPTLVSSAPVSLASVDAYCARNGGVRLAFYNLARTPDPAADTPMWTVYLAGMATSSRDWPTGLRFTTGLAFALIPDDAPGLMAGDVVSLNLGFAA